MADSNTLKGSDQIGITDDDPFAELTRIMGFDPRQPVAGKASVAAPSIAAEPEDDYGIDLEKELMGEFSADEVFAAPAPEHDVAPEMTVEPVSWQSEEAASPVADSLSEASVEPETAFAEPVVAQDDFDFPEIEFDASDLDAPGTMQPEFVEPIEAAGVEAAFEPRVEFDDAPAFEPEQLSEPVSVQAQADWQEPEFLADVDFDLTDDVAPAEAALPSLDPVVAAESAVDVALDFSDFGPVEAAQIVEPSLVDDLDFSADFERAFEETEEPAEVVADQSAEHFIELDASDFHEDAAPANIAQGSVFRGPFPVFHAPFEGGAESGPEDASAFDLGPIDLHDRDEVYPVTHQDIIENDGFDRDERIEASSFANEVSNVDPVVEEPAPVKAKTFSFEEELNALLGAAGVAPATRSMAAAAPAAVKIAASSAPAASSYLSKAWTPPKPVAPPKPQSPDPVSDLEWMLRDDAAATNATDDGFDDAHLDFLAEDLVLDTVPDTAVEPELPLADFDDAAFANALAGDLEHDDITRSAQPEPAEEDTTMPATGRRDPLDEINAMTARYSAPQSSPIITPAPSRYEPASARQWQGGNQNAAFDDFSELETIEVSDRAVALADDLDLPDVSFEDELPPVSAYDDLDSEFSNLLTDMNTPEPAQQPAFREQRRQQAASPFDDDLVAGEYRLDEDDLPGSRPLAGAYQDDDFGFDQAMDDDYGDAVEPQRDEPRHTGRGLMIAGIVAGVAVLGGIGAFALSFGGGSGSDAPAIVAADDGPIKVKPANPGGTSVPNQDNKVYDTVAGESANGAPQQERLVTTSEEPADVSPPQELGTDDSEPAGQMVGGEEDMAAADDMPAQPADTQPQVPAVTAKGEDRIQQIVADNEADPDMQVAAIAPRRVRTMIVKPDGTLVAREEPTPVSAAPAETAAQQIAVPELAEAVPAPAANAAAPRAEAAAVAAPQPIQPAETAAVQTVAAQPAAEAAMPETMQIAPQRPAEQPIDVVGEVKPDQVAAVSAPAARATGGSWAMQIASQPTEAAAQSSYQDLARRFGGVLSGREVNIVKAEIAGKGTFWRVRVPANSRNDAVGLCENYKAAGGNCFVSR